MTTQEAIRILEQSCPKRPQKLWSIKRKEAVKMAIEALQRGLENVVADSCSEKPNRSDTIYRQDAIDVAKQHWYKPDIAKALEELPSEQPELYCSPQPDLSDDGTLMMTVPHGMLEKVKRVMVDEFSTKFCKVMYQDAGRKKGEWIPVSERLPEVHRSILIATSQGYVAEGEYDGMYNDHHKWIQYRWSATLWDGEVIAYMPLPEPYKGDTDE